MSFESAIYEGFVRHRRFTPHRHDLCFSMFMMYVDLAEIPRVFDGTWFWSARRPAPARFRRDDYHGDPALELDAAVRATVAQVSGTRPEGPIRLLTHLRYFGYVFNPVSFYYCFDRGGERVESIVAEITNTPWKERHAYVLSSSGARPGVETQGFNSNVARTVSGVRGERRGRFEFDKVFHVSPFMPSDIRYDWRFGEPGHRLGVQMNLVRSGTHVFDATLSLTRREITPRSLDLALLRFPALTARVAWSIHWNALRLWLKGVPVVPHPSRHAAAPTPREAP